MVEPISLTLGIAVGASVSLAVALFGEEEEEEKRREEEEVCCCDLTAPSTAPRKAT